jgi:Spy/CpxP family protein refolding chaperone
MKKILAVLATTAAALGFVLLTGFHGGGCGHGPHSPAEISSFVTGRLDSALDDLAATPAQRDQIHAIKDKLLADGLQLRSDGQAARDEVLAQWKSETPDRAKLHALVDQRVEAYRAFAHEAVDAGVDVHGILTPDQRAKVTSKIESHMQH